MRSEIVAKTAPTAHTPSQPWCVHAIPASVAGYTTDESWAYRPKEGVEAFESITFFIRFIYAINFEHLLSPREGLKRKCRQQMPLAK